MQTPVEASSDEQLLRDKEAAIIGLGRSYAKLKSVKNFYMYESARSKRCMTLQRPSGAGAGGQGLPRVHHEASQGEDGQAGSNAH